MAAAPELSINRPKGMNAMERRQRWQWIEDDGEDVLWNCPSCGRDIHADFVGSECPACGTPVEDDE